VEIGSGTGFTLRALGASHPNANFLGLELDERLASWASEACSLPNVKFVVADVTTAGVVEMADLVISADTIHHFHDPPLAFSRVRALLRPGGRWVAIEPNIWHPYITASVTRMKMVGYDEDHFRPWRIDPTLRAAGFVLESRQYLHAIPSAIRQPPVWVTKLERRLERFVLLGGSVVYRLRAS
jgi:trans-aconitate methyltransferase